MKSVKPIKVDVRVELEDGHVMTAVYGPGDMISVDYDTAHGVRTVPDRDGRSSSVQRELDGITTLTLMVVGTIKPTWRHEGADCGDR